MRRLIVLSRVALLGLSAGAVYGDSAPVNPPEPVEVFPVSETADAAPARKNPIKTVSSENTVCGNAGTPAAEVAALEPTTVLASSSGPAANPVGSDAPARRHVPPVATHLPDLNKPDPALLTRQVKSGYYVNTVRVLLPAGIKVTVRKDWYARDIVVVYPKNPYTNWRGVTPDALAFNHVGVVMEILPSGTKYVPTELTVIVPNAIKVEVR